MDRIYTNQRNGERRIHVEITESEISDLLDDIGPISPTDNPEFAATTELRRILVRAHDMFAASRMADAYEATL